MTSAPTRRRRLAALAVALTTTLAGLTAATTSPATAGIQSRLCVTITDAATGKPVKGAEVTAADSPETFPDRIAWIGTTNANGMIACTPGSGDPITPGTWFVSVGTPNTPRLAGLDNVQVEISPGDNQFSEALQQATVVTGTVRAPSGAKLRNISVQIGFSGAKVRNGRYRIFGVEEGQHPVKVMSGYGDDVRLVKQGKRAVVSEPGQRVVHNLKKVKIHPGMTVRAKSPSAGRVAFAIAVKTQRMGLPGQAGKVTIKRGSKVVARNVKITKGTGTVTIGGQPRGAGQFKIIWAGNKNTLARSTNTSAVIK